MNIKKSSYKRCFCLFDIIDHVNDRSMYAAQTNCNILNCLLVSVSSDGVVTCQSAFKCGAVGYVKYIIYPHDRHTH